MASILDQERISLSEAARRIKSCRAGAKQTSAATIWRWSKVGARRKDGRRVRLQTFKHGSVTVTSVEAVEAFFAALNADDDNGLSQAPAANQHVEAELDRIGI